MGGIFQPTLSEYVLFRGLFLFLLLPVFAAKTMFYFAHSAAFVALSGQLSLRARGGRAGDIRFQVKRRGELYERARRGYGLSTLLLGGKVGRILLPGPRWLRKSS